MAVTEGLDYMPLEGRLGSATMEGSSNAAGVTPEGVRAGDRAALQALVDRRGPAVVAFCMQVCGPQAADRAAAEAFARFRAAVRDAPELRGLDPEALLRGATRHAAASMARQPSGPPPHGRLLSRGTQTCEHVPTMLAARANGALGDADLDRLARHLDRCERCDALAEIFRRAELAYQDPVVDTLGTDTSTVLLVALQSVSEHGVGTAPAPSPDAPAAEPLDGAFGHLPDLDDEVPIEPPAPLETTQVDELAAEPLAAEPSPADTPPAPVIAAAVEGEIAFFATGEHDAVDPGATVEWDELPDVAPEHEPGVVEGGGPAAGLLEGGHTRRTRPRPLFVALPVLLIAACAAGALALAGVFGGNDATPPVERTAPARVQAPVTTPLPVTVKAAPPAATAGAGTTGAAGTATTGAAGTASTPTPGATAQGAPDASSTTP
ncbi:MAG TPA: zf-HC2 domain-containing protein [Baekduia sp.]|uniref:zf-HC2 domain-containing protein n=1 Tax=Baekduia sp. TaxID=2600305 RepID=UPI002D130BA8|nr:zf-HC2 domain-containing protein [Baekduia sp.]HMJ33751.1 zf-HC2 domain-containing protein [Baekduia sp.]